MTNKESYLSMNAVKLLALSHQTAELSVRELFHFPENEIKQFMEAAKNTFNLEGLMLLCTCNRTEIYFESPTTSTEDFLNFLLKFKDVPRTTYYVNRFWQFEKTVEVSQYLLEVASGLRSQVIGDMQIISQVKQAFLLSQSVQMQGKVLERIIQSVFKMHKRIQNETEYRKGSASTSYLALQASRHFFGKGQLKEKKLLLVGAGEIMRDVAKYTNKFAFKSITIINRTKEKAQKIAKEHHFEVKNWEDLPSLILGNDVIISGVSNRSNLIQNETLYEGCEALKLFVDLGMPANIDKRLEQHNHFKVIDIDHLSSRTQEVELQRKEAIEAVEEIVKSTHEDFLDWLKKMPINQSLNKLKQHLQILLEAELMHTVENISAEERQQIIHRVSQKFIKTPAVFLHQQNEADTYVDALEQVFSL